MPDFGFVGPAYEAASIYQDDQALINWYCEVDPNKKAKAITEQDKRGVIALYPTPGLALRGTLAAGQPVRALWTVPGGMTLLAVCGNGFYSVDASFTATLKGTLSSSGGPVSMTDNGLSAYLVDGGNRYSYDLTTGVFAQLAAADGAFTGGTKVDIVDNFLVYNNPGTQQFGNTNVGSVVSGALNFASADSSPDNLVSLIVVSREAFFIKESVCEVWGDAGLFPVPFQRIAGTNMQHGCIAPFSVARLGEGAAWLSHDTRGQNVVIRTNGYQPIRISNHAVEAAFATYGTVSDAIGYTYQQAGHEFYMLSFPSADVTWCYDLATDFWHRRAYRDAHNNLHRHRSNCCAVFQGQIIVGDWENGRLYAMSQSTYTDADELIPCIRRCPHITTDLKNQFFHDLQIQFQPGVGLQSGQGSNPQAMLTWSDDGGSTWSNQHWTSIGQVGKYKNRAIWRRLGWARDRIFEVAVTDPVYRVIVSANLNATAGAH